MPAAIKQIVTVRPGGVVEVRSPELHEGERAEVTIVIMQAADAKDRANGVGRWRRHAGALGGEDAHAADTPRIDADLAAEYGNEPKSGT